MIVLFLYAGGVGPGHVLVLLVRNAPWPSLEFTKFYAYSVLSYQGADLEIVHFRTKHSEWPDKKYR